MFGRLSNFLRDVKSEEYMTLDRIYEHIVSKSPNHRMDVKAFDFLINDYLNKDLPFEEVKSLMKSLSIHHNEGFIDF